MTHEWCLLPMCVGAKAGPLYVGNVQLLLQDCNPAVIVLELVYMNKEFKGILVTKMSWVICRSLRLCRNLWVGS